MCGIAVFVPPLRPPLLEMASAKYKNLFQYLKKKAYPKGFTKQKNDSAKFAKEFEYDSKLESLF